MILYRQFSIMFAVNSLKKLKTWAILEPNQGYAKPTHERRKAEKHILLYIISWFHTVIHVNIHICVNTSWNEWKYWLDFDDHDLIS